jgi:HSP20 family molecular chaperone IbpA
VSVETTHVARPRGEVDPADLRRIKRALARRDDAQAELRQAVVDAHEHGASYRVLVEATGFANTTIQDWVKQHRR